MKRYLTKLLSEALGNMYQNGQIFSMPAVELEVPKEKFGDYSTNVAFSIARGGKFNPNEVAEILARELRLLDKSGIIKEIKVIGGFLNFFIAESALAKFALEMQKQIEIEQIGFDEKGKPGKVVFEYSSPNTNKPLHIGHTRNDVFGMACINLLRVTGHKVIACEVINDRGIHIMKSLLMYQLHGADKTPKSEGIKPDHFVGKFYAMFGAELEKNPGLEQEAQELLQKWEAGDSAIRKLWKQMNAWFYEGVAETYKREGSEFDEVQYESDIYDKGRDLVLDGVKKGVFTKEPDGSIAVDLTAQGLDKKYLLRADGTAIYITQDLYLWSSRYEKHHPNLILGTTSSEQTYHFNVLSKIFALLGFEWAPNFKHLPYEHVYLGKTKMSSRAGNAVTADDLLVTIKEKVRETMRNTQKIKVAPEDDKTVEAIAFAAIKYGYLKYDSNTKIYFDIDETIAIEGNTGPYLQYAYARIQSILEKAGKFVKAAPENLSENSELELLRLLPHYDETVTLAAREFRPNLVCNYLLQLVPILAGDDENLKIQRLNLLLAVAAVLEHGLALLGIKVVVKM